MHWRGRHRAHKRLRLPAPIQLSGHEKEGLLVAGIVYARNGNRSTERAAELVECEMRAGARCGEEVLCVELGVAQKLEQRTVQKSSPGLQHDVCKAARCAAKLRIGGA